VMCCEIDFSLDLDFGYIMKLVLTWIWNLELVLDLKNH